MRSCPSWRPLILEHQAAGTIAGALLNSEHPTREISLGGYVISVDLRRNAATPRRCRRSATAFSWRLVPTSNLVAGNDIQVTFRPATPGPSIAGLAEVWAGRFVEGRWVPGRKLSGDDILLNYKLDEAAAVNQSAAACDLVRTGRRSSA